MSRLTPTADAKSWESRREARVNRSASDPAASAPGIARPVAWPLDAALTSAWTSGAFDPSAPSEANGKLVWPGKGSIGEGSGIGFWDFRLVESLMRFPFWFEPSSNHQR